MLSSRIVARIAGISKSTPANCSTKPRLPSIAFTGGLRRRGAVAVASLIAFAITDCNIMPTRSFFFDIMGSFRILLSFILFNASFNVVFSLIVISGVLIMSFNSVVSAYTVSSLTLLRISSSVTMPTG